MQNIEILLEDEKGKKIKELDLNFVGIISELWKIKDFQIQYEWLSTIDPYGNTIFNVYQIPKLIEESQELLKQIKDQNTKNSIKKFLDFSKEVKQHIYLRFVGD